MTERTQNPERKTTIWLLLPALILLSLAAAAILWAGAGARETIANSERIIASITVEPFVKTDSTRTGWDRKAFADSLAISLGNVAGVRTRVGRREWPRSDYTVKGAFRVTEGRLVITTRLVHARESSPVWSGTFWRSEGGTAGLAQDVAASVAEALYADIARRSFAVAKEKS